MKRIWVIVIAVVLSLAVGRAASEDYATHSALSSGRWVKISVDKSGVYKLTASALQEMGFSDIAQVSVHGYGGWMLDEDFSATGYQDDVPQVPVWRDGETIYFYAKGPVKWNYEYEGDIRGDMFVHENNPYATAGYYFVTDATEPSSMQELASVEGAVRQITTFDDYQVWETEAVAVNESGRQLFGESFQVSNSRSFSFSVPGVTDDDAVISMRFIANTSSSREVTLSTGDAELRLLVPANNGSTSSYTRATAAEGAMIWSGEKPETVNMDVTYGGTSDQNVYLDYIRLQTKRALRLYGAETAFRSVDALNNVSRFQLENASESTVVFDIADTQAPKLVRTTLDGTTLSFSSSSSASLR